MEINRDSVKEVLLNKIHVEIPSMFSYSVHVLHCGGNRILFSVLSTF